MACKTSHDLHHNFPKIADEAGFTFNTHRPRMRIDWNRIRIIDIENLVRERKFSVIEHHLNDILDCIFESEFDVRILDEGVLKMFRLAQLAVEYQQFCRHYLDRSVYVLREEINSLAQELDFSKKELKVKDEEIRKLKRKTKHTYRTPLPYGNDNIANMIIKTLTNKTDYFPTNTTGDTMQFNKCSYCEKVFMNQLYLKSHIARRHSHITELPQKDTDVKVPTGINNDENTKLSDEVLELKLKLKDMEEFIKNANKNDNAKITNPDNVSEAGQITQPNIVTTNTKIMKDVEISTNNDINILDKIEEWKKEEQEKYNREIDLLRNQIKETVQSLKDRETTANNINADKENKIIEKLNSTISQQGSQILTLKQELIDSQLKMQKDEAARRKESETQMTHWVNRAETHAKQYESLLQKLNDVAKEAKVSRMQAEAERERVAQLEELLQRSLNEKSRVDIVNDKKTVKDDKPREPLKNTPTKKKFIQNSPLESNRQALEQLHQKAQALLNIRSSSSSEESSADNNIAQLKTSIKNKHMNRGKSYNNQENMAMLTSKKSEVPLNKKKLTKDHEKNKEHKNKKVQSTSHTEHNSTKMKNNGHIISGLAPGSPIKIVRAKIMEEVNNRLISAGVDPLNKGLPKKNFLKQRSLLHEQEELKAKRNSLHEKAKHSILTYLDSKVPMNIAIPPQEYISPSKISKAFKLTSVISNVKNKALSLVKSNDVNNRNKKRSVNSEVAKRAMTLLNTPPDSLHSSPITERHNMGNESQSKDVDNKHNKKTSTIVNQRKTMQKVVSERNHNRIINSSSHSEILSENESSNSDESGHKYYKAEIEQTTKSIEKLIKSPARRPLSANFEQSQPASQYATGDNYPIRSQSATNISLVDQNTSTDTKESIRDNENSSDSESSHHNLLTKSVANDRALDNVKQTKGVLKNASSTSSLNKKKVLFDMDAIQMKSLSASPSQSITEKSDGNEKFELGLINLDGEEWDISSIENEPLNNDTNLRLSTKASPKIAELKQTIESQLARRNETLTAPVGGIDVLPRPLLRASSVGGSNTNLGSSILDESETLPPVSHKAFVKPKNVSPKDDSEIDLSEFSTDGIATNKNDNDAF